MLQDDPSFIGILPAAGLATRLRPFRYPKELLPIVYVTDGDSARVRPRLVAEYALDAMRKAGIPRCFIVISEWKTEIFRYFGNGMEMGIQIAYLHQPVANGLVGAISTGMQWFGNSYVCLTLPDTIFFPMNAIAVLRKEILISGSDLILGVFPTAEPEHLGPVRIAADGCVLEVLDKPAQTELYNTWGNAIWSQRFTQFLQDYLNTHPEAPEHSIGEIFNHAVTQGLKVDAVFFGEGQYIDIGRVEGIGSLVLSNGHAWQ